jgi:hypothetical protein
MAKITPLTFSGTSASISARRLPLRTLGAWLSGIRVMPSNRVHSVFVLRFISWGFRAVYRPPPMGSTLFSSATRMNSAFSSSSFSGCSAARSFISE